MYFLFFVTVKPPGWKLLFLKIYMGSEIMAKKNKNVNTHKRELNTSDSLLKGHLFQKDT